MSGARAHLAWWAFLVHRVSGLALALFILRAAHVALGLRLLALELLPWRNWQKTLATLAAAFAIVAGLAFALAR